MQAHSQNLWLAAQWPLQDKVIAGVSLTPHPHKPHGFNLALHVDDDADAVRARRAALLAALPTTATPMWLSQVHGATVADSTSYTPGMAADAALSRSPQYMPVVMTADCLPILLADGAGDTVAAIHAGWPGLHQGIIARTIEAMQIAGEALYAWIGPAISAPNYEVDEAFRERFLALDRRYAAHFHANRPGHFLADLPAIAQRQLQDAGLLQTRIFTSNVCSFADRRFFSHRRDRALAGRMASFIVKK
ncbi:MAG: peptidoglycan editing factor PgeF [Cardiobacteriaceae bacterium]|nr:peptidoglycan editing factor PgeF [Cardiobacteriaceae bacterium]